MYTADILIPPITHHLGKKWRQPDTKEILMDVFGGEENFIMTEAILAKIQRYDSSIPSAVYEGKMWVSVFDGCNFTLKWFQNKTNTDDRCDIKCRKIRIVSEEMYLEFYNQLKANDTKDMKELIIKEIENLFNDNKKNKEIRKIFEKYSCKNCELKERCDQHVEVWEENIDDGLNQYTTEFCSNIKIKIGK